MSQWIKVDPATLRVGDKIKMRSKGGPTVIGTVDHVRDMGSRVSVGCGWFFMTISYQDGSCYIRKPKRAKRASADCLNCGDTTPEPPAPVRPDEPPVYALFKVDRTGIEYMRVRGTDFGYQSILDVGVPSRWDSITEPGDTITLLELREVGK